MKKGNPIFNLIVTEWNYLGNMKRQFFLHILLFVIANLVSLSSPFIVGTIFNSIQTTIITKESMWVLIGKIWLLVLVTIVFWIFHGVARIIEQKVGFHVEKNYLNNLIDKTFALPLSWHRDHHTGDTIDKINNSSSAIGTFSKHLTFRIVGALISLVGSLFLLLLIDWKYSLFALFVSAFTIFVTINLDKILNKKYDELNKGYNKFNATIFDYLSNIRTVITLRKEKIAKTKINEKFEDLKDKVYNTSILNEKKWAFVSIIISLMTVMTLSFKTYFDFTLTGTIMIGTLFMLYGYLDRIGDSFFKVADLYGGLVRKNSEVQNTKEIRRAYKKFGQKEKFKTLPKNWKTIEIKNLNFKYNEREQIPLLKNINLKIKRGQKIALIGESGSGKSTILSIIRGIFRAEKGEMFCDGKKMKLGRLKNHTSLIPQDPEIFEASFKFNITMGQKTSEKELTEAITMARLEPVLDDLKNGLDTMIKEKGVTLSGGQKQRVALARGILSAKDNEIILLDEPTSSVDSMNELEIYRRLFSRFKNKTIISTVHRLHLLNGFDYVYMIDRGKVVAEGKFNKIMTTKEFKNFWKKYKSVQ